MDYRFLGETGLRVSALSLGAMTFGASFGGVAGVGQGDAQRMVDVAVELGINVIDTADVYSRGASEEVLGRALKGKRDKVLVATKVHGPMSDDVNDAGQSRHHIVSSCHASLRRLGVDHIDLYQLHNFDAYTSWEQSLGALTDLVRQGKVRYVGCSNLTAWQTMTALSVAERRNVSRFVAFQGNYSLVAREAEYELIPMCQDQGMGFLVWSPLAGGYLTGKYEGGDGVTGRRFEAGDPGVIDEEQGRKTLAVMQEIASQHGASVAQVALNWLQAKPAVTSVIVGARTMGQLSDNLASADWRLSAEEILQLDDVSARPKPYPYWHQEQYNAERHLRTE